MSDDTEWRVELRENTSKGNPGWYARAVQSMDAFEPTRELALQEVERQLATALSRVRALLGAPEHGMAALVDKLVHADGCTGYQVQACPRCSAEFEIIHDDCPQCDAVDAIRSAHDDQERLK